MVFGIDDIEKIWDASVQVSKKWEVDSSRPPFPEGMNGFALDPKNGTVKIYTDSDLSQEAQTAAFGYMAEVIKMATGHDLSQQAVLFQRTGKWTGQAADEAAARREVGRDFSR